MIQIRYTTCCGLREVTGLSNYRTKARKALMDLLMQATYSTYGANGRMLKTRIPFRFGMFLFTQASEDENPDYQQAYGEQLKRMIEKFNLGTVTVVGPFHNPNTHNHIRTYNWVIDWNKALRFLHQELRKKSN